MRVRADDGELRPWHYIYVYREKTDACSPLRGAGMAGGRIAGWWMERASKREREAIEREARERTGSNHPDTFFESRGGGGSESMNRQQGRENTSKLARERSPLSLLSPLQVPRKAHMQGS